MIVPATQADRGVITLVSARALIASAPTAQRLLSKLQRFDDLVTELAAIGVYSRHAVERHYKQLAFERSQRHHVSNQIACGIRLEVQYQNVDTIQARNAVRMHFLHAGELLSHRRFEVFHLRWSYGQILVIERD